MKNSNIIFSLGIKFTSETTGFEFHIINNWLVHLMHGLISLVNDNTVDNNLNEILVYVYFWVNCKQSI